MIRRFVLALAAAAALGAVSPVAAPALAAPAALSADQQALVDRAQAYLQSLKTVTGRFTQTDASGATFSGVLYLQRPGKARFEYYPPSGLLIVADGHFVAVSDKRLKTFNEVPLRNTPLAFLLARDVRLDRGIVVTGAQATPGGFTVSARGPGGRIALDFRDDPTALAGWTITDDAGRRTRVALGPLSPADHLAAGLFYVRDPRAGD